MFGRVAHNIHPCNQRCGNIYYVRMEIEYMEKELPVRKIYA